MGISKIVNEEKNKKMNSIIFSNLKTKWAVAGLQKISFVIFSERGSAFSLGFRSIGPSVFDGARSKVVLRSEGYAWTPIWWSSDNSKR